MALDLGHIVIICIVVIRIVIKMHKLSFLLFAIGAIVSPCCFSQVYRSVDLSYAEMPHEKLVLLDSLGVDEGCYLNEWEAEYIDFIFDLKDSFDLKSMKIIFLTSSSGSLMSNKKHYFQIEKERHKSAHSSSPYRGGVLFIFDEKEKEKCGGYDAAIEYWNKIRKEKKDVIKCIRKAEKRKKKRAAEK